MGETMISDQNTSREVRRMVIWSLAGAGLGLLVWLLADLFVFFPVFLATGTTVGLALNASRQDN